MVTFSEWLLGEMRIRGWSARELGKRAGMSNTAINDILNEYRKPTFKLCKAIARPLGMEPEDVMRKAGLLPSWNAEDTKLKTIYRVMNELPSEAQDDLIRYARWRLAEERGQYKTNGDDERGE